MSTLADYLSFARGHPGLFVNPPQGGITVLLNEEEIREAEKQETQRLEAQGLPAEWAQVGFAYRDQYVLILRDAVHFPDGSLGICIRSVDEDERAPGVVVLPHHQGRVLLIRHFRHGSRAWHLEVPQGFGILGLSSEESIRLELQQEISATISRLVSLGRFHPDACVGANVVEVFYADIETYGDIELQEGIIELLPTPVSELERMIREKEIDNVFLVVTYARAKLYGLL